MDNAAIRSRVHELWTRLRAFLQDFYPQQWSQMWFVVGGLVAFAGVLPSGYAFIEFSAGEYRMVEQFLQNAKGYYIVFNLADRYLAVATFMLVFIACSRPWRNFLLFVFLPAIVLISAKAYLLALAVEASPIESIFDSPRISSILPHLGLVLRVLALWETPFFAGLLCLVGGLIWNSAGAAPLPVRFRGTAQHNDADSAPSSRDLWLFVGWALVAIPLLAGVVALVAVQFTPWPPGKSPREFMWQMELTPILGAVGMILTSYILLGKAKKESMLLFLRFPDPAFVTTALAVLLALFLPRFLCFLVLEVGSQFRGAYYTPPPTWDFLVPPLWTLIFIPIAVLTEISIRGYFQTSIIKQLNIRRGILLTGLLWMMTTGAGSTEGRALGAILLAIPAGWLALRSGSAWPSAFLASGYLILQGWHLTDLRVEWPRLIWAEFLVLAAAGYFLFRRDAPWPWERLPIAWPRPPKKAGEVHAEDGAADADGGPHQ